MRAVRWGRWERNGIMERELQIAVVITVRAEIPAFVTPDREPGVAPDDEVRAALLREIGIRDDVSGYFYAFTGEVIAGDPAKGQPPVLHVAEPWQITGARLA